MLQQVVEFGDEVVVQLLEVLLGVLQVVLGHLFESLEPVARLGTCVPKRYPPFHGNLVQDIHELLSPLLVERG